MQYEDLRFPVATALIGVASLLSTTVLAQTTDTPARPADRYVAQLTALNTKVTESTTAGEAQFEVVGDNLVIDIHVTGAPASITHWQHFHGLKDGRAAACATGADDANKDGIVDVIETGKASGTTMVPFDNAPAAMDVAHGTYPKAAADGSYFYHRVVPLKDLQTAFGKAFDGQKLQLDHRVVYIHGVPAATNLPASVASLGTIPAAVTLPIACGKIERVK